MLTCQKHLFSLPDEVAYLNCAYMSPLPLAVELAGYQGVARKALPFEISADDFFSEVAEVKKLFSRLIHADDYERIAVIPSVSFGMASVVSNVKPSAKQNIVLVEAIFPSNYYPWKRLADDTGASLKVVPAPSASPGRGAIWNEKLLEAIDSATAVVALPNAHWADGTLFDLAEIRRKANEAGALLVIDGTQSVGAFPFDVRKIQPDALICGGYKWLLGPYGIGLAYYGERFDGGVPVEESWINRLDSEKFDSLVNYQPAYKPKAHRYNVGENSQFIHMPMMKAGLELLLEWGVENIQDYCRRLSEPFAVQLANQGCWVEEAGFRGGHLFGIRLPGEVDLEAFNEKARAKSVFVSVRGNSVRVSPHLYNDDEDFERLMEVFRAFL
jgi:selenocysteine lyase/cysteine desulfurase